MLPRQILLTVMLERPSLVYSTIPALEWSLSVAAWTWFVVDALFTSSYPSEMVIKRLHTSPPLP